MLTTNPDCKKLPENTTQMFHLLVAKLLYLFKQTRQDIQTVVAFLCMCVKKLTRMITRNKRGCST